MNCVLTKGALEWLLYKIKASGTDGTKQRQNLLEQMAVQNRWGAPMEDDDGAWLLDDDGFILLADWKYKEA